MQHALLSSHNIRRSLRIVSTAWVALAMAAGLPSAHADDDLPRLDVDVQYYSPANAQTVLAFSADSRWIAAGLYDGSAQLFDVAGRKWALHTRVLEKGGVETIALSPDGSLLAMAGNRDGVLIVDAKSGSVLKTLMFDISSGGGVLSVVFSPDGKLLAATDSAPERDGYDDKPLYGEVRVWSTADWSLQQHLPVAEFPRSVEFSADGSLLAVSGDKAIVTDWRTGKTLGEYDVESSRYPVSISPDGQMIATSSGLYDVKSRGSHGEMSGQYTFIDFNKRGTIILAGSTEDGAGIWDAHTGVQIADLNFYTDVGAFSPDGTTIAGGSEDGLEIVKIDETALRKRVLDFAKYKRSGLMFYNLVASMGITWFGNALPMQNKKW